MNEINLLEFRDENLEQGKNVKTIKIDHGVFVDEFKVDGGTVIKIEGIRNKHQAWKKITKAYGLGDIKFGEYHFETWNDGDLKAWIFYVPDSWKKSEVED